MTLDQLLTSTDQKIDYDQVAACLSATRNGAGSCPDCLHQQYFSGNSIDYTCDQTRLIYVLRFLPVHMQENLSILEGVDANRVKVEEGRPIEVLAIGGGPGSEIAALRKFVLESDYFGHPVQEIHVTRLDRVDEWTGIHLEVRKLYESDKVSYKYSKITGDVTTCADFDGNYDLVFLSYILSELSDSQANKLAEKIHSVTRDTAVLVLNDRNQAQVIQRMKAITEPFNIVSRYTASTEKHFGLSYPDEIRKRAQAKLQMKSYRLGAVVTK